MTLLRGASRADLVSRPPQLRTLTPEPCDLSTPPAWPPTPPTPHTLPPRHATPRTYTYPHAPHAPHAPRGQGMTSVYALVVATTNGFDDHTPDHHSSSDALARPPPITHTPPTAHPKLSQCINPNPNPNPHQVAPPPTMSRGESPASSADGVPTDSWKVRHIDTSTSAYGALTYPPLRNLARRLPLTPQTPHAPPSTPQAAFSRLPRTPHAPHAPRRLPCTPRPAITTTEMRNTTWSVFSRPPMNSSLTTSDPVMEPALPTHIHRTARPATEPAIMASRASPSKPPMHRHCTEDDLKKWHRVGMPILHDDVTKSQRSRHAHSHAHAHSRTLTHGT